MASALKHAVNRYAVDRPKGKTYYWSCIRCRESGDFTSAIDRDTSADKHLEQPAKPRNPKKNKKK